METTNTVISLPRLFLLEAAPQEAPLELPDPGRHLSPQNVCLHYAPMYPLLTTAIIEGPVLEKRGEVYFFKPALGTKA